jgi:hypothetical protein
MTAQGISDSFVDAERLTDAIDAGLSGRRSLEDALAEHEASRNERVRPMYEFTQLFASLEPPPPEMQRLFGAMHGNQGQRSSWARATAWMSSSPRHANIFRGPRGAAGLTLSRGVEYCRGVCGKRW